MNPPATTPSTPDAYIDALDEPHRSDIRALHELVRAAVPQLEPTLEFGMLGYGTYHYRYASGREGDWMLVGLMSRKRYISLYVTSTLPEGRYIAEAWADRLPKASVGRSCIRVKRAADLDPDVVTALLREAAAHPPGEMR